MPRLADWTIRILYIGDKFFFVFFKTYLTNNGWTHESSDHKEIPWRDKTTQTKTPKCWRWGSGGVARWWLVVACKIACEASATFHKRAAQAG